MLCGPTFQVTYENEIKPMVGDLKVLVVAGYRVDPPGQHRHPVIGAGPRTNLFDAACGPPATAA
jgi:hypothetical protein